MLSTSSVITVAALAAPLVIGSPLVVDNGRTLTQGKHEAQPIIIRDSTIQPVATQGVGQAYYWTDEWQNQEAIASSDLRENRYQDFQTAEDAVAWLFDDEA